MMKSTFSLQAGLALMTGCQRGTGKAMAVGLAGAGADIIGVFANLQGSGIVVAEAVMGVGRNFFAYQADLRRRESLSGFVDQIPSRFH